MRVIVFFLLLFLHLQGFDRDDCDGMIPLVVSVLYGNLQTVIVLLACFVALDCGIYLSDLFSMRT